MNNQNSQQQLGKFNYHYFILILFAALPVLNFISQNTGESNFSIIRSSFYLIIIILISLSFSGIIRLLLPRIPILFISLFIGLSVFVTFNGYLIENFVFSDSFQTENKIRYVVIFYLGTIFLCGFFSHFIIQRKKLFSIFLAGVIAFALTDFINITLSTFAIHQANNKSSYGADMTIKQTKPVGGISKVSPLMHEKQNVYFILPDMMIGEEVFDKFDIEPAILDGFRQRGFYTIARPRSNAPVTEFSLAHIFGMNYYLKNNEQVTKKKMQEIKNIYIKENKVYQEFRNRGYKVYALNDGYWSGCGRGEDNCIRRSSQHFLKEQDLRFIERTAFMKSLDLIDYTYNIFPVPMDIWPYINRMEVPEIIGQLPHPQDGPYFLYMHLGGLPHYPLRFSRDCTYQRYDEVKVAYAEQYRCAVKSLEMLIDAIQSQEENPLIIVHSDHGVGFENQHLKQVEELTDDEMLENVSIFSAFKFPNRCHKYLSPGLSPVNTFRLLFACLDNRKPELLPDRNFLVYYLRWPSGGKVREWIH